MSELWLILVSFALGAAVSSWLLNHFVIQPLIQKLITREMAADGWAQTALRLARQVKDGSRGSSPHRRRDHDCRRPPPPPEDSADWWKRL